MRELVEKEISSGVAGPMQGRGRSVTVNVAESPLARLHLPRIDQSARTEPGERLRADFERASIAPRVTMRWETARVDGGGDERLSPTEAQVAAKRRFDNAIAATGPGLNDVLWRVVCAGEALPQAEKALGWPARAGRVVLTLALDRLADHYKLP
jgi:hypothetical protein